MKKKKFKITLPAFCYIIAAILLIYAFYSAGSTIHDIKEYYTSYKMSAPVSEVIAYTLQSALQPMIFAFLVFVSGRMLSQGANANKMLLEKLDEITASKAPAKKSKPKDEDEQKAEEEKPAEKADPEAGEDDEKGDE